MNVSILYVVLLLVLFAGVAFWLRRRGGLPGGHGIEVRGHRRLDGQHALWIVEVDGRRLLVGGGRDGVRLVQDLGAIDASTEGPVAA